MAHDRFDFEQQIMDCWRVTDDIKQISESSIEGNLTLEEATNILVGLRQMYELKFNKLWDCFEDVHMKLVRDNTMITGECNALRQQLLEATDVPFIRASNEKKGKK